MPLISVWEMKGEGEIDDSVISTPRILNTLYRRSILALAGFASGGHRFAALRQASQTHLLREALDFAKPD